MNCDIQFYNATTGESIGTDDMVEPSHIIEGLSPCEGIASTPKHLFFINRHDVVTVMSWSRVRDEIAFHDKEKDFSDENDGDKVATDWRESWKGLKEVEVELGGL